MARKANRYNRERRVRDRLHSWRRNIVALLKVSLLTGTVACVSAALVIGYYALVQAPYFTVKGVEIAGIGRVDRDELVKAMGIRPGMSILEVNLRKITRAVENMPWVERVSVRRRLPDHLVIRIWEHEPWAVIHLDRFYYVDRNCMPFKTVEAGESRDYPIITGIAKELFFAGGVRSEEVLGRVRTVMSLIAANKAPFGLDQVSEINVGTNDAVTLLVDGGMRVVLGTASYEKKFHRLSLVHDDLIERGRWQKVQTINLDLGNRVLVS